MQLLFRPAPGHTAPLCPNPPRWPLAAYAATLTAALFCSNNRRPIWCRLNANTP